MIGTKRITIGRIALAPSGGAAAGGRGAFFVDFGATVGLVAMLGIFGGFW